VNLLTLDFETYYDAAFSLKRLTIPEYVHDARFHVHGLAIRHPDGRAEFRADVHAVLDELQALYGADLGNAIVLFHNASFDLYILTHYYRIRIRHFVDTMLLSHNVNGRRDTGGVGASLKALAGHHRLQSKTDLSFMAGVRNPNPEEFAALSKYACNDVEITFQLALHLLPKVTRPEVELRIMAHSVRLFTDRFITVATNAIPALQQRIQNETASWLQQAGVMAEDAAKDGRFASLLEKALARTGRRLPLKPGKNGPIPAISKKDQAMLALLDDDAPVVSALAHARLEKKGECQLLAKLETLRRVSTATGGRLPVHLTYGGAHTLRFSGGQKFNIQNLGKSGFGLEMRHLLSARDGCKLVIGDLAQIEARVLAWLAGETDLLFAFAQGQDIYCDFASELLDERIRKSTKDDSDDVKRHFDSRRQLGKFAILGLGYAMGPLRCMNTLRADRITAPLFAAGVLSPLKCREVVRTYRRRFARITKLWDALEVGFRCAMSGSMERVDRITFERREEFPEASGVEKFVMLAWLPSGRALRYPRPRLENEERTIRFLDASGDEAEFTPGGDSIAYGHGSGISLYGGKLAENIVQAIARDILVESILRMEHGGYPVLFHVHDEVILEVESSRATTASEVLKTVLRTPPQWAAGLPLDADVRISHRYGK
jgi:DNA polymerase